MKQYAHCVLLAIFCYVGVVSCFFVTLSHNGPVVLGANITFKAELFNAYGERPSGTFRFRWKDNALPPHHSESEGQETVAIWNVSYPSAEYPPGPYEVEVSVDKSAIVFWPISSQRISFNITALLNGKLDLMQLGNPDIKDYVSNTRPVSHMVQLSKPDYEYLKTHMTSKLTYWFVDCIYYGYTTDYSFAFNYTVPGKAHHIEALIVASYEPPTTTTSTTTTTTTPTPPTTTTTATTTQTAAFTSTNVTSFPPSTTTTTPSTTSTVHPPTNVTQVQPNSGNMVAIDSNAPYLVTKLEDKSVSRTPKAALTGGIFEAKSINLPFVCLNKSVIPPDPNKTYGYFHRHLAVKAPVSNVSVVGTNWLQHGDMLNLLVSCNGSSDFRHCLRIVSGLYNVTGNETCAAERITKDCLIPVIHYFREPATYTILIIISNDVSHIVTPVAINIYEVKKRAQLSVIVVPVTCSLVAVILIVFGVAYYMQSRNRYTIEVADFDFGQGNDMEYKTFQERLREAVTNAFNRSSDFVEGENVWPPGRKYGIMQ